MSHLSWAHKEGKNVTLQEPGASLQTELPVFEKSASALMNMRKVVKSMVAPISQYMLLRCTLSLLPNSFSCPALFLHLTASAYLGLLLAPGPPSPPSTLHQTHFLLSSQHLSLQTSI